MQPSWRRRFLTWQVIRANRLILDVRRLKCHLPTATEVMSEISRFLGIVIRTQSIRYAVKTDAFTGNG